MSLQSPQKTIVITGCSSGFGRATTLLMAQRGWHVFATVRKEVDQQSLQSTAEQLGLQDNISIVLCDITDQQQVAHLCQVVGEDTSQVEVLVNNAGVAYSAPVELLDLNDLRQQFEINVFAHIGVTQSFLPLLKEAKGTIINISSVGGLVSLPTLGPYSASKYALEALSDAMRIELAPFGVQVVLLEPGSSITQLQATGRKHAEKLDRFRGGSLGPLLANFDAMWRQVEQKSFAPELVAQTIEKITRTPHPRPRYLVAPRDRQMLLARKFLSDRTWDRQIRKMLHW
ncbi:MAG TPA: SDR family oxidoreductase [Ktedonobacterales bacterium]|nr:SDR family oxidoreductase [Ktedonobacterales bacterium]